MAQPDNTHHWGKYHCTVGFQFSKFEFNCFTTSKNNIFSLLVKCSHVKLEISCTVILPPAMSVFWPNLYYIQNTSVEVHAKFDFHIWVNFVSKCDKFWKKLNLFRIQIFWLSPKKSFLLAVLNFSLLTIEIFAKKCCYSSLWYPLLRATERTCEHWPNKTEQKIPRANLV